MSNKKQKIGFWSGFLGAGLALLSSFASAAPFTPAVFLALLTGPMALIAIRFGAWRIGVFGLYWTLLTVLVSPNVLPMRFERAIVFMYLSGLAFGVGLVLHYRQTRNKSSAARH